MNLLLLEETDLRSDTCAMVSGQRAKHFIDIVGVELGSQLRCGKINGLMGNGVITALDHDPSGGTDKCSITLTLDLTESPPPPSHVSLLCALPRPKMVRRMVRTAAELGVKRLTFINAYRVEKSYWQSPQLSASKLRDFCLEGLSQSGDTQLPEIILEKRFKPFVEDRLPHLLEANSHAILAHPYGHTKTLADTLADKKPNAHGTSSAIAALGPEGGFIEYEVEQLKNAGFEAVSLGERILRCDTALPFLLAQLQTQLIQE